MAHANAITLLDGRGTVVRQQVGFGGTDDTIRAAQDLIARSEVAHR